MSIRTLTWTHQLVASARAGYGHNVAPDNLGALELVEASEASTGSVVEEAMGDAADGDGCPASTIFAGWRQSVLPVHLLSLAPLLGSVGPVAGDVKLQDDGVVHDPVNRRGGGHGVGKDALPLREDQV